MPQFTAEQLKSKTAEELAILGERNHPNSAEGILIKNELQRRLIPSPEKNKRFSKILIAILIGVVTSLIAGILLILYWPK